MKKIKIGLITNNNYTDKYTLEIIEWIKNNNDKFIIDNFIIIKKKKIKNILNKKFFKKIFFKIIILIERILLLFYSNHKNHFKKYDLNQILDNKIEIFELKKKNKSFFTDKDIEKIENQNYDLIIRACTNILSGKILDIPKYGIISFHHGDIEHFRGTPAGFWEVFYKKDSTGFIIQRLNENLDNGEVLFKGYFQTKFFYLLNQAEVNMKSIFYFKKILKNFYDKKVNKNIKYKIIGKVYEVPGLRKQIIYLLNLLKIIIKKIYNRKVFWKILYFNCKNEKLIKYSNNHKKFLADPFIFKKNDKKFIFAEEFCFKNNKGHIVCIDTEIKNTKKIILEEDFHLSFPFIFSYQNEIFMCPETSSIKEIRLYIATDFPYKWNYHSTLINNINSVDNIIFSKNNIWWLLANLSNDKGHDFNHDLSIFYSMDGPLTNNWISHQKNPIFVDSRNSRNAGFFTSDNHEIYRVSQKQGFDQYGKGVNFNKIEEISLENYQEKEQKINFPVKIKNILDNKSVHHFSKDGQDIVFDFN